MTYESYKYQNDLGLMKPEMPPASGLSCAKPRVSAPCQAGHSSHRRSPLAAGAGVAERRGPRWSLRTIQETGTKTRCSQVRKVFLSQNRVTQRKWTRSIRILEQHGNGCTKYIDVLHLSWMTPLDPCKQHPLLVSHPIRQKQNSLGPRKV